RAGIGIAERAGELLAHANRLKIHPEDRRNPDAGRAGVIHPVNFVDDRLGADVVELLHGWKAARGAGVSRFRRVQVLYAMARRSMREFVREMLIGPGGATPGFANDLENRVCAQELVRINGLAPSGGIARELCRVDAAAAVERLVVDVDRTVIHHLGPPRRAVRAWR